ncbi:hypothetical protein B0H14DRAFT_3500244 [Mycena olivaceomarginata]|nr:hypothetical protein B0H14DRAFT_3500244 [Mycena olivaceomarginata]
MAPHVNGTCTSCWLARLLSSFPPSSPHLFPQGRHHLHPVYRHAFAVLLTAPNAASAKADDNGVNGGILRSPHFDSYAVKVPHDPRDLRAIFAQDISLSLGVTFAPLSILKSYRFDFDFDIPSDIENIPADWAKLRKHGKNNTVFDETAVDEFQQGVDDLVDIRVINTAMSVPADDA